MNETLRPGILELVVLTAAVALTAGCPREDSDRPNEEEITLNDETVLNDEEPNAEDVDEDEVVVEMTANRFEPAEVTVDVGQTVRWRNTSQTSHTVTADPVRASDPANVQLPEGVDPFHSGNVAPGEEYTREFTESGTYRYVCLPHEAAGMLGTVTVRESNEQEASP